MVYQKEIAPETKKEHWQGYIELPAPLGINSLKKNFGSTTIHVEPRRGTREQARNYCTKTTSRKIGCVPVELGEFADGVSQGTRSDLKIVVDIIKKGGTDRDILEANPGAVIRYGRGIRDVRRILSEKRKEKTNVTVLWGPGGCGKSEEAQEAFPDAYYKNNDKWWDGYEGQDNVIIDEFQLAEWKRQDLLRLFDKYPLLVETKGGMVNFNSKRICITTNEKPQDWFGHIPELQRRIELVIEHVRWG